MRCADLPHEAQRKGHERLNSYAQKSVLKAIVFSLFLAVVAAGIFFYLVTFCGAIVTVYIKGVHMANAPGLDMVLRKFALPAAGVVAAVVFAIGMRRPRVRDAAERAQVTGRRTNSANASPSVLIK
ncbi:MAG TPA: hypothetical protein VFM10_02350 [Terriglobales bacterium]|nr:hypothetical protein [Terriglobales bacterium]